LHASQIFFLFTAHGCVGDLYWEDHYTEVLSV
jgi:hypothetical protein